MGARRWKRYHISQVFVKTVLEGATLTVVSWGTVVVLSAGNIIETSQLLFTTFFAVCGLIIALFGGRIFQSAPLFVEWPFTNTSIDIVTNFLIFNWIIGVDLVVATILSKILPASVLSLLLAAILPFWFLRHTAHLFTLLQLDE